MLVVKMGTQKGSIPWNKGIKQWEGKIPPNTGKNFSENTKKKISEAAKNRIGILNHYYGKQHTKAAKIQHQTASSNANPKQKIERDERRLAIA
jgi:hypothetical protein